MNERQIIVTLTDGSQFESRQVPASEMSDREWEEAKDGLYCIMEDTDGKFRLDTADGAVFAPLRNVHHIRVVG